MSKSFLLINLFFQYNFYIKKQSFLNKIIFKYYMINEICKTVVFNKNFFVPFVFTKKQYFIIKKYLNKKSLNSNEKVYFYGSITKKLRALSLLRQEYFVRGKNMIFNRIEKSKKILSDIGGEAFVSGSFLHSKNYEDIDVFVISKKRKQFVKEGVHYVFITMKDLEKPIFASAMNYCVSNFALPDIKVKTKRFGLENTLLAYQLSISELNEDGFKSLKNLIMEYYLVVEGRVLDSFELSKKYDDIKKGDSIKKINALTKKLLLNAYSKRYLYLESVNLSKKFAELIKKYESSDLIIYKNFFDELKNECRTIKKRDKKNTG